GKHAASFNRCYLGFSFCCSKKGNGLSRSFYIHRIEVPAGKLIFIASDQAFSRKRGCSRGRFIILIDPKGRYNSRHGFIHCCYTTTGRSSVYNSGEGRVHYKSLYSNSSNNGAFHETEDKCVYLGRCYRCCCWALSSQHK